MGHDKRQDVKPPAQHAALLERVRAYLSDDRLDFRPHKHSHGDDLRVRLRGHPDFAVYLRLQRVVRNPNYGVFIAALVERQGIVTHGDDLRRLLPALGDTPPRVPERAEDWAWFGYKKGLPYDPDEDGLLVRLASEVRAYIKGLELLARRGD